MKTIFLDETTSTNDFLKSRLDEGEDMIVCAKRQTGGRGTKGRSFSSEEGGVYLSKLTFHHALSAKDAFGIMTHSAVAVCRTAEQFGIRPEIKWCNDVLAGGRKLAGILIENVLSDGYVKGSIVGIGLNVSNPLPGLGKIAVGMCELLPVPPTVEDVRDALIANLDKRSDLSDYLHYVHFLGKTVSVTEGEKTYSALAREILPDGRLLIEENGTLRALSAAEISIGF